MGNFPIVQGLVMFGLVGLTLHVLYRYLCLWWRLRLLEQQLRVYQQLIDQAFTEIHNGPLQVLAFLIREVQIHQVPQQELLKHLREVYQDVLAGVQNLKPGN